MTLSDSKDTKRAKCSGFSRSDRLHIRALGGTMSDNPGKKPSVSPHTSPTTGVGDLAAKALSVVASRSAGPNSSLSPVLIERLLEASMERSNESYRVVTRHMLAMGISAEFIVDDYVPAVARRMGDEWCDDVSSFAAVSLGSSRLQALLRELGTIWSADQSRDAALLKSSALILMPDDSQHTLGAAVMSTQVRRAGLSARVARGIRIDELVKVLQEDSFDAMLISASMSDSLDKVQEIVHTAKNLSLPKALPVVIGGSILEHGENIQEDSGADLATSNINEALNFCGIT